MRRVLKSSLRALDGSRKTACCTTLRVASRSVTSSSHNTFGGIWREGNAATGPDGKRAWLAPALAALGTFLAVDRNGSDTALAAPGEAGEISRLERWQGLWANRTIGWHKPSVNPVLEKYLEAWLPSSVDKRSQRILVPLCGKTVDLPFLACQKAAGEVIGVEGVPTAIEQLGKDHDWLKLQLSSDPVPKFKKVVSAVVPLTLLIGDYFEVNKQSLSGQVDKIWDRASLVAISPDLREQYVQVQHDVLKPGGQILLVTLVRAKGTPEAVKNGPPFTVPESEVRRLYDSKRFKLVKLQTTDVTEERHRSSGLELLLEEVYMVTKL